MDRVKRNRLITFMIGFIVVTIVALYIAPLVKPTLSETLEAALILRANPLKLHIVPATGKTIIVCWLIYFLVGLHQSSLRKETRSGEEHGSAVWGSPQVINKAISDKEFFKNRILSNNMRLSVIGRKTLASLNTLVCGGMGSGKSFFILIANLLQGNTNFVVTDPSGELAKKTGFFLKYIAKYRVLVVDVDDLQKSIKYNFFEYIKKEEDILEIVDIIFEATSGGKTNEAADPMWEIMAKDRLIAYIAILMQRGNPEEQNMETVIYLYLNDEIEQDNNGNIAKTAISELFADEELERPGNLASSKYKSSTTGAPETIQGVNSTLSGRMSYFLLESVRRMMSDDELDLERFNDEKTALFFVAPSEKKTFNFIVSMILTQLLNITYAKARNNSNGKLDIPLQFFIDEMANFVLPKEFVKYCTTARKHEISFTLFIQELAQLEEQFGKNNATTIKGTCKSFVYLGGSGYETEKQICEEIGNQTIITRSDSESFGIHGNTSKSTQASGRSLIMPDELNILLQEDKCLVHIDGKRWVVDKKNDTQSHKNYKYTSNATGNNYDWSETPVGTKEIELLEFLPPNTNVVEIHIEDINLREFFKDYEIIAGNLEEN